ncbi:MAG TPA: hypothetical protein VGG70_01840 [Candidatus Cybelea sp.]|jgi:predicted ATPase
MREQRLFRRLAIFFCGWDKSLVVAEAENARYGLLESTRAFALEKLAQSGERAALAPRHAQWAADLGDRAGELWTAPMSQFRAEFDSEFENARSAIDWSALARRGCARGSHHRWVFESVSADRTNRTQRPA